MNGLKKVWIAGANGRVGSELQKLLNRVDYEILATDIDEVDITKIEEISNYAEMNRPHYIINCAGVTDARLCEKESDLAFRVNAIGARNLSIAARKVGARIVQLSTDDVFDGNNEKPYNEFDTPNPRSVYGKSKLAGENFVRELTTKHIIIRSSWMFGSGTSYVTNLLKMADENVRVGVASDQIASPTSAKYLAEMILYLMEHGEDGLYHVTCQGSCSRYEFAKEIIRLANRNTVIYPVNSDQDTLTILRPSYSVLDNLMLRLMDLPPMPTWQQALSEYMKGAY